eukprot:g494.t1
MWDDYVWILITASLLAFFTSFGIGANDVANAFGTSVGAKSVTLPQAIVIAGIFEFAGALLLGADVTSTISHGLVDTEDFENSPELLMYGMMCVIASTGLWLILACYLELPVSSTHSTIGGVIGFAIVAHGWNTVKWYEYNTEKSGLEKFEGVAPIVIYWLISPILSGLISVTLFYFVRQFILRKEDSLERSFRFFPFLVGIACVVNLYYILLVGFDKKKVDHNGKSETISHILGFGWASLIAWTLSLVIVVIISLTFIPWLRAQTSSSVESSPHGVPGTSESAPLLDKESDDVKRLDSWLSMVSSMIDVDVHGVIETDVTVQSVHANSESFDVETERCFSYLQVFTAASAIFAIYRHSRVTHDSNAPIWILCLGGAGIVTGLAVYGHTIIRSIGVKLVKVSPARGFAMEFATATVVAFGSINGIPLSTTHCQVGSTTAVGLLEGTGGVNKMFLLKVFGGWIVTIAIVALTTALLFAQGVYAPSKLNLDALQKYKEGVNHAIELASLNSSRGSGGTTHEEAIEAIAKFEEEKQDVSFAQVKLLREILSQSDGQS